MIKIAARVAKIQNNLAALYWRYQEHRKLTTEEAKATKRLHHSYMFFERTGRHFTTKTMFNSYLQSSGSDV